MKRNTNIQIVICIAVTLLVLLTAAPLYGAKGGQYGQMPHSQSEHKKMSQSHGHAENLQSVNDAIGKEIMNHQDQTLSEIRDVIVDKNRDRVYYVVLSAQDALRPVPWSAFSHDDKGRCRLNIAQNDFETAPTVDTLNEQSIQTLAGSDYRQKVKDFYSQRISGMEKSMLDKATRWMKEILGSDEKPNLILCSSIIGLDVRNKQGDTLAELENLVVDTRKGHIAYGLVSFGGMWGIGEDTAAVPWNSLTLRTDQGFSRIDATEQTLNASVIEEDNIAQLSQPQFARQIHDRFGTQPYWEVFGFVAPQKEKMSMDAWMPNSSYNQSFDPAKITTIKGTIKSVGTFRPEQGAAAGTRLKVKTQQGQSMTVYAGPCGFAKHKDVQLKTGSDITITGSKTKVGDKTVLMACEIQTEGETLTLRDPQGNPKWDMQELKEAYHKEKEGASKKMREHKESKNY